MVTYDCDLAPNTSTQTDTPWAIIMKPNIDVLQMPQTEDFS